MLEEILAYLEYLEEFNEVKKPKMPKFNLSAYTDSEYINEISLLNEQLNSFDDIQVTLNHLKEE